MAEKFNDDPLIQELNDSITSLQEEKQRIVAMLIKLKLENLRLRSSHPEPTIENDTLEQYNSDSDSSNDLSKEVDELNRDSLQFAYDMLLKDYESDKRHFQDALAERDEIIEEQRRKLSVLPSMEEHINTLQDEKDKLEESLRNATSTHRNEISALKHKLDDLQGISDKSESLQRTIDELSNEKQGLELELEREKMDTGGRKLTGSSEAYQLVQLQKTNAKLLKEIEELHDIVYRRRKESTIEDNLIICGKVIDNCLEGNDTVVQCPLCGANVPGKDCALCKSFERIIKLKAEKEFKAKEPVEKVFPQSLISLLVITIVFVIIQCWLLICFCFFYT